MKKYLALFIALLMSMSCISGCGQSATPTPVTQTPTQESAVATASATQQPTQEPVAAGPKEINWARAYDVTSLDPHEANDNGSYEILFLINEGLVRNDSGTIVPGVAESWEVSKDGLELVFHLRQTTWSDGTPLTAEDFKYSFLRMGDPNQAHYQADGVSLFKNGEKYIKGEATADEVGIEVVDNYTLKLTVEKPSISTLYMLAGFSYGPVNKTKAEAAGVAFGSEADTILTNGPFTLVEWSHEDKIVMEKNQNYWDQENIHLTKITGIVGALGEAAVDMLLAGELDFIDTRDFVQVQTLVDKGFTYESYTSTYQFVRINNTGMNAESGKFMSNQNFRKALNYAVNRDALVASVYQGAQPANRLSSPDELGVNGLFNEEYPYEGWPSGGDAALAKECLDLALAELGATIEDVPELSMLCFEAPSSMLVMQAVQDMFLTTLGISCKIDPQPIQQMIGKAIGGEWDFWWGGTPVGAVDWATDSVAQAYDYTAANDVNHYINDKYVELLDKATTTLDMKERKDTLFEMEKELCENPGGILIGWTQSYLVFIPELTGLEIGVNYFIGHMDLQK